MFDGGFSATSLPVFTALAPAGAVAFVCLAAFLLVNRSQSRDWRDVLAHLLFIPLAIAWVGFIASATHLGTPANALHAINGLGRSPLSNEVVSAVAFLFFAGMAWMYSYREKPKASVMNGLLAISIVCVIVMLFHTSRVFHRHGSYVGYVAYTGQFMRDGFVVGPGAGHNGAAGGSGACGKVALCAFAYSCGCACCGHGAARMPYEFLGYRRQ